MVRADAIYLIAESPGAHGVFDAPTETERMVYCTIRSVGMNETYAALSAGIQPQYVFVLSDYSEYQGEKIVKYNNVRYKVIRTYEYDMQLEITVEKEDPNA